MIFPRHLIESDGVADSLLVALERFQTHAYALVDARASWHQFMVAFWCHALCGGVELMKTFDKNKVSWRKAWLEMDVFVVIRLVLDLGFLLVLG